MLSPDQWTDRLAGPGISLAPPRLWGEVPSEWIVVGLDVNDGRDTRAFLPNEEKDPEHQTGLRQK